MHLHRDQVRQIKHRPSGRRYDGWLLLIAMLTLLAAGLSTSFWRWSW